MNEIQFKKLVDENDLILDEGGFFFVEFGKRIRFNVSDYVYDYLNKVFQWYAEIGIDDFKERIQRKQEEKIFDDVNENVLFLKGKIKDEIFEFDSLVKNERFNGVYRVDELKNYWFLLIENEDLLRIVTYLKFSIMNGDIISKESVFNIDYFLFQNYFIPEKLNHAYKGMRIPIRINFLQRLIDNLTDSKQIKGKEKREKPTHRTLAIIHKYKEEAKCEGFLKLDRKSMRELGGKNREQAFDTFGYFGSSKNKNYKAIDKDDLEKVIPFLEECSNAKRKAINDLENLKNS